MILRGFGLSITPEQAAKLEPMATEQQTSTLQGVKIFCDKLKNNEDIDALTLLSALLEDLRDYSLQQADHHKQVSALGR